MEARHVLRQLLRSIDRNLTSVAGNTQWRDYVLQQFRDNAHVMDSVKRQQGLQLAKDYAVLISNIAHHRVSAGVHVASPFGGVRYGHVQPYRSPSTNHVLSIRCHGGLMRYLRVDTYQKNVCLRRLWHQFLLQSTQNPENNPRVTTCNSCACHLTPPHRSC